MPNQRGMKLLAGLLLTGILTACARGVPVGAYPGYTSPGYTTPSYGQQPYYPTAPSYGTTPIGSNPYGQYPYDPSTPGVRPNLPTLVASIEGIQNGEFLGIGRFSVQVRILNPTMSPLAGMLRVDFLAGSKVFRTTRDRVMLMPGQSVEKTFEDPSWRVNNAHVAIEADTPFAPMSGAAPLDPGYNPNQPYGY